MTTESGQTRGRLQKQCSFFVTGFPGNQDSIILGWPVESSKSAVNAKVEYIRNLTNAALDGSLLFDGLKLLSAREVITELTKLCGIGNWTAKMHLIFVLNRLGILPFEDGAFLQSYRWVYQTEDCNVSAVCKNGVHMHLSLQNFFIVHWMLK